MPKPELSLYTIMDIDYPIDSTKRCNNSEVNEMVEKEFVDEEFLEVITDQPICVAEICRRVGCSRGTGKRYLQVLEYMQKIKRINIIGSVSYFYVKNDQNENCCNA
jgi:predicted transcriptional regulator